MAHWRTSFSAFVPVTAVDMGSLQHCTWLLRTGPLLSQDLVGTAEEVLNRGGLGHP